MIGDYFIYIHNNSHHVIRFTEAKKPVKVSREI